MFNKVQNDFWKSVIKSYTVWYKTRKTAANNAAMFAPLWEISI